MTSRSLRPALPFIALALLLALLALARPLDHDESQYVAAVQLARHGLLPFRDFAYLQTPLQPILFSPLAALFGSWLWPGLRVINALLGVIGLAFVWTAMRAGGASVRTATAAAALLTCCDVLLFSVGVARNDALPFACLCAALLPIMRAEQGEGSRLGQLLAGVLLAAAAAAKISYALPAIVYGGWALLHRRHRPAALLSGALPVAALVVWTWWQAPADFLFGVFTFPARAPEQFYLDAGRPWKLSFAAKMVDAAKFLALGPALLAGVIVVRGAIAERRWTLLDGLALAGLLAGLLPEPTWRQYLLPLLPPLFVRLALVWQMRPPSQTVRVLAVIFAAAGLAPSVEAVAGSLDGLPMMQAMADGRALRQAMDDRKIAGPVATLSPEFLPATGRLPDIRLAPGPFVFRSRGLVAPDDQPARHIVTAATMAQQFVVRPPAILVGGEGRWTSGDPALDGKLEAWALVHGYLRVPVESRHLRLYVPPS